MRRRAAFSLLLFLAAGGLSCAADEGTARLVNIATRAAVGGTAGTPIPGFVLSGPGAKPIVVRAIGPTLGGFGVSGVLADPRLGLVSGVATSVTNDNWNAADAAAMTAAGGFALTAGARMPRSSRISTRARIPRR